MTPKLKIEIVTPDGVSYEDEVDMVTLPAEQGEMGIYPHHVPLMTQIVAGEIMIYKDGRANYGAIGNGFAEITGDKVSILTDMVIKAADIDEAKAEEARLRAQARLAEVLDDEEAATVEAALARSLAQLKVKRRHHDAGS